MAHKLIDTLERDIRNQVVIDQLKRLNRKQKLMVLVHQNSRRAMIALAALIWVVVFLWSINVWADDLHVQCPDPGVKCKVLLLNPQEEEMLMTRNGILDTAAQGRSLDLGQFSVYLKTRIGAAPQGEVKPMPVPPAPPADINGTKTGNNPAVLDKPNP